MVEDAWAKSQMAAGNPIAPIAPPTPARAGISIEIADYCSPAQIATDISRCGQVAIDAASFGAGASYGGGTVHFPADLSPYKLLGTLRLDKSFLGLSGDGPQASYIQCANGAADCIVVGIPDEPTRDQHIESSHNYAAVGSAAIGLGGLCGKNDIKADHDFSFPAYACEQTSRWIEILNMGSTATRGVRKTFPK